MQQQFDNESWESAVWQPANLLPAPKHTGTFIPSNHLAPEQEMTSQLPCSREPTKSDWDRMRPEIEMLYPKHGLKATMAIMKQKYNLKATEKMYKDRRHEWGISKNIKSEEMEAIVRKTAQRRQAGKESYFQLRRTWVTDAKIKRYRRDKKILSEQQAMALRAGTPPGLKCYTLLASPLITPREFEVPERLIKIVHDYVNGSFDSNTWVVNNSGWCMHHGQTGDKSIIKEIQTAAWLLSNGEFKPAWQALHIAMSCVGDLVCAEEPQTVFDLIAIVLDLFVVKKLPDIALAVLRQFHNMSTKLVGEMHPLSQSSGFIKELAASHNMEALGKLIQVGIDDFTFRVGGLSRDAVEFHLQEIYWSSMFQHNFDSIGKLQALLKSFEDIDSPGETFIEIQLELTKELRYAGRFQEAFEICESVAKLASGKESRYYVSQALRQMSRCHEESGDLASAVQSSRQAIEVVAAQLGFEQDFVLSLMVDHQRLLERCGALDEAMQVRDHRDRLVASKYETISREEEEQWQRYLALEGGEQLPN